MKATTQLELPYPSRTGNHSVKHAGGKHYLTKEAQAYRDIVAMAVRGRKAPEGMLYVAWTFCPPDRRARDADNLLKVVKDALTHAGFWADDSNKVIRWGSWEWGDVVKDGVILLDASTYNPTDI